MPIELPEAVAGHVRSANARDAEACARYSPKMQLFSTKARKDEALPPSSNGKRK